MNRYRIKTYAVCILIAIMLFSAVPAAYAEQIFTDIESHWAKSQITDWAGKGLIKGYPDGSFKPDNNITRAEFIAMVNRAFGYEKKDIVTFKDVPAGAWYYDEVAKARAVGYISGYEDGTLRPDNPITRAETAAIIMRIKGLAANPGTAEKFTDASEIPIWSRGAVGAAAAAKIMNGYPDGSFKAGNTITRAEAVVALNRALGSTETMTVTYDKADTYGPAEGTETVNGSVVIKAQDVTLQNTIIEGDLIIDKAVGEGNVTLKNVTVKGTAYINGGGANSVHLIDTNLTKAVVLKTNGTVRIVAFGKAEVGQLVAQSSVKVEEANLSGKGFVNVIIEKKVAENIEVTLAGAKLETIEVKTQEAILNADKNTEVKTLEVKADNITVKTEKGTVITTLVADGKVSVTGQGSIQKAVVNVSGVSFETAPQSQEVAAGVTEPIVSTGTTGGTTAGGSSSGGGGGSSTPTVTVNAINNVSLFVGQSTNINITTTPADANLTASSNNTEIATVSVSGHTITVTAGETAGNATITVTAAKSGYNNGTRTFTVAAMPGKPASFELGAAKGSLYIDMSSFKDQYGNDIVWGNLVDAYGLDLANSKIYLTTGEVTSDVYATLGQLLEYQVNSIEDDIPELQAVLANGGTVIHFDDENMADIFSGLGLGGMFVGFNPAVHTWVYAEIKGTFNAEAWEISDSCEMPEIGNDVSLQTFNIGGSFDPIDQTVTGGYDVLELANLAVSNPISEQGATLNINAPTTGIFILTNDPTAIPTVTLDGAQLDLADLSSQLINDNTVIVVAVTAQSGTRAYYKVTVTVSGGSGLTDEQKVAADKAVLSADIIKGGNADLDNVTLDLNLVSSIPGGAGCSISWASSNESVVATDGTVTRPAAGSGDATVTLTATITSGSASDTKQFTVTVKQAENIMAEGVVTDDNEDNTNIDAAIDSSGNIHLVYLKSSNLYYKKYIAGSGWGTEELVAESVFQAAIAVDPSGNPHIAYVSSSGAIIYKTKDLGSWGSPQNILDSGGQYVDLDVSPSGTVHFAFEGNIYTDDSYMEIGYRKFNGGTLTGIEVLFDGFYWYESGGKTGRYYSSPSIKADSSDDYHVVVKHHALDGGMGWTENNRYLIYKSNAGTGMEIGSESNGNNDMGVSNNPIVLTSFGAAIVYNNSSGNMCIARPAGTAWNKSELGTLGSSPSIDVTNSGNEIIAYTASGNLYYMEIGSAAEQLDSGLVGGVGFPVVLDEGTKAYVLYVKSDSADYEVYCASKAR